MIVTCSRSKSHSGFRSSGETIPANDLTGLDLLAPETGLRCMHQESQQEGVGERAARCEVQRDRQNDFRRRSDQTHREIVSAGAYYPAGRVLYLYCAVKCSDQVIGSDRARLRSVLSA